MLQEQCNQEPADAAIAIQVRMDGFELHMQQARSNQRMQRIFCMDVFFQGTKQIVQQMWGRRYIDCIPGASSADPVLAAPDLSWGLISTGDIFQ